ncbi:MAG: YmdB family metallophosphoesterase [Deltaproteobacteria bacterium]|jgi:metallophosphoesterase (TIGR00282 family)|nr:YmdB family metallophosphoesterase [Deltaproteobacteria bacterium]
MTRILFLGDIFARTGRRLVRELVPPLFKELELDLALANGENAAGGRGLTSSTALELLACGLSALSGGNHTFRQRDILNIIDHDPRLIRPANYPSPCPGRGWTLLKTGDTSIGFGNLMGRIFMTPILQCPFKAADQMINEMQQAGAQETIIDIHAEATSEKKALAFHLDGRIGALLGTHTHVQTADCQILPGGTAYITDVGMTGAHYSVIGMAHQEVVDNFLTARPRSFRPSESGGRLEGVLLEFNEHHKVRLIQPVTKNLN